MTHEYTLLVNGTVILGPGLPDATALAFALDTVLAVGSDEAVHAISRGDSRVLDLSGIYVTAAGGGVLEPGSPANLDIFGTDPRLPGGTMGPAAVIRAGVLVSSGLLEGRRPGSGGGGHGHGGEHGHGGPAGHGVSEPRA